MRNGSENGVKLLLRQRLYALFLRYTSVVKTFNADSGCSLCPTLFYLGYDGLDAVEMSGTSARAHALRVIVRHCYKDFFDVKFSR